MESCEFTKKDVSRKMRKLGIRRVSIRGSCREDPTFDHCMLALDWIEDMVPISEETARRLASGELNPGIRVIWKKGR